MWHKGRFGNRLYSCDRIWLNWRKGKKIYIYSSPHNRTWRSRGRWRNKSTFSSTSVARDHAPAALPRDKEPVPIVQKAGWAPGLPGRGAKNLAPHNRIRSPDHPVRSESLYRLSYPGLIILTDFYCCWILLQQLNRATSYLISEAILLKPSLRDPLRCMQEWRYSSTHS